MKEEAFYPIEDQIFNTTVIQGVRNIENETLFSDYLRIMHSTTRFYKTRFQIFENEKEIIKNRISYCEKRIHHLERLLNQFNEDDKNDEESQTIDILINEKELLREQSKELKSLINLEEK